MLSPLDLKLMRDMGKMKGQMMAVAVVMACGLAMMIMSRSLILSLESTRDAYYTHNRFADVFSDLKLLDASHVCVWLQHRSGDHRRDAIGRDPDDVGTFDCFLD